MSGSGTGTPVTDSGFSYSWSDSDTDRFRLMIGDTDPTDPLFSDAEIAFFLETYPNAILTAAGRACQSLAIRFSRIASKSMGDLNIQYGQIATAYAARAQELLAQAVEETAVTTQTVTMPTSLAYVNDLKGIPSRMKFSDIEDQIWSSNEDLYNSEEVE